MTVEDVSNNKTQLSCFYCRSVLANYPTAKYLLITDDKGEVICIKRTGETVPTPMIYCSSDCMVFEAHLRYTERVKAGTFRKQFNIKYAEELPKDQLPQRWKDGQPEVVTR